METKVNEKDFYNGRELYLYLHNYTRDKSGTCELSVTDDLNTAARHSSINKIFKVTLEEIELEEVDVQIHVKRKVVKAKQ